MRRLRRFAQLSATEKQILIRVLFAVGVARAALCFLSTGTARKVTAKAAYGVSGSVEQMVWAVRVASR
jgi:hypothetical protein